MIGYQLSMLFGPAVAVTAWGTSHLTPPGGQPYRRLQWCYHDDERVAKECQQYRGTISQWSIREESITSATRWVVPLILYTVGLYRSVICPCAITVIKLVDCGVVYQLCRRCLGYVAHSKCTLTFINLTSPPSNECSRIQARISKQNVFYKALSGTI